MTGGDPDGSRDPDAKVRLPPGTNNTGNPGVLVGSVQEDAFGAHAHAISGFHLEAEGGSGFHGAGMETNSNRNHEWTRSYGTSQSGGKETRPKNAYVYYIIKL